LFTSNNPKENAMYDLSTLALRVGTFYLVGLLIGASGAFL
jgi:hypothetical protein